VDARSRDSKPDDSQKLSSRRFDAIMMVGEGIFDLNVFDNDWDGVEG
jgi:hypothetical protein